MCLTWGFVHSFVAQGGFEQVDSRRQRRGADA
jgi:hypothetical protein